MSPLTKSQNLSIMIIDIKGYTATSSQSSRTEILGLIRRYNQLMSPIIKFYNGRLIKGLGDGSLCTFESATDAVVCGIVIQMLIREYNRLQKDENQRLELRVIINTGDVTLEQNDIFGEAVNVTARIEALDIFDKGGIGITEATYLLVNRNEIVAEKIGPVTLKGIPEPVTVYSVPLEKQKLNRIPARLLKLVETAVDSRAAESQEQAEWAKNIKNVLGNYEKTLAQFSENISSGISATLGKASLIEMNSVKTENASLSRRFKSFIFDIMVLAALLFILNISWIVAGRFLFGPRLIKIDSSFEPLKYLTVSKMEHMDKYIKRRGSVDYFVRPRKLPEKIIDLNIKYPLLLSIIYFGFFWWKRGATPGQLRYGTAVIMKAGGKPELLLSLKRAFLFVFSILFLGAGLLPLFTSSKETYYDRVCDTKVIQQAD